MGAQLRTCSRRNRTSRCEPLWSTAVGPRPIAISRSDCGYGSGRSSTAFTSVKTAIEAARPRPSVTMAASDSAGRRNVCRSAKTRSCTEGAFRRFCLLTIDGAGGCCPRATGAACGGLRVACCWSGLSATSSTPRGRVAADSVAFHHLHLKRFAASPFLLQFYERLFDPATTRRTARWRRRRAAVRADAAPDQPARRVSADASVRAVALRLGRCVARRNVSHACRARSSVGAAASTRTAALAHPKRVAAGRHRVGTAMCSAHGSSSRPRARPARTVERLPSPSTACPRRSSGSAVSAC